MKKQAEVPIGTYNTHHAQKVTGASYRQLQWWDEAGLFPSRVDLHGHARMWTPEQLIEARIASDLRHKNVSLQMTRQVLKFYRKIRQDFGRYLLTDGKAVKLAHSGEEALKLILDFQTPVVMVEIPDVKAITKKAA